VRTIYKVIPSDSGKVIVQSNDGKLYSLESENGGFWWDELPPLPQDTVSVGEVKYSYNEIIGAGVDLSCGYYDGLKVIR